MELVDTNEEASWCVVIAKPMNEELAEKTIRSAGYRVYLPRSIRFIRERDEDENGRKTRMTKAAPVVRPAFRGYLFFELWPDQQWRHLMDSRHTRGVQRILTQGDRPVPVHSEIIKALREHEDAGLFDEPVGLRVRGNSKRRHDLSDGETVRIGAGAFAGFLAQLEGQDDQGRATALVELLGRLVPIQTDAQSLERIGL